MARLYHRTVVFVVESRPSHIDHLDAQVGCCGCRCCVLLQQYIFGLEVGVSQTHSMHVAHRKEDLLEEGLQVGNREAHKPISFQYIVQTRTQLL